MHKTTSLLLTLALLPACAATTGETPVAGGSGGKCSNEGLESFIGQKATGDIGAQLREKSGARTLRWGPPRSAMTMDYREDRLTVAYDDDMVIESARCG